jgi:hypothetical protein
MKEKDRNPGTGPSHQEGTLKGEETVEKKGREPGRDENADSYRSARDSTGINPKMEESITPGSKTMPPP